MTTVLTRRMQLILTAGAFLAISPAGFHFDQGKGMFSLDAPMALARGGSDDSGGDDHGGSSGSDDSGHHGSDDDSDDDNGHHSSGDDNGSHHSSAGSTSGGGNGASIMKFETYPNGLEVVFADGTKIEIQDGRYERKNAAGRTVEERRATQADVDQLLALR